MFKNKWTGVFSLLLLTLIAVPTYAKDIKKFGYVDTGRVYLESTPAQHITEKLQEEFTARREFLKQQNQKGLLLREKLDGPNLSKKDKKRLETEFTQLEATYQTLQQQFTRDYSLRRNEEFMGLQRQANQVILQLAKKQGFDLILQDAVYVKADYDITNQVIDILNAQQP